MYIHLYICIYVYICMYTHVYIYIYREREREINISVIISYYIMLNYAICYIVTCYMVLYRILAEDYSFEDCLIQTFREIPYVHENSTP